MRPVLTPNAAARHQRRSAVIDYSPEEPQTRHGRIRDHVRDRSSQRGRTADRKWTLQRAITSHHRDRWIPSQRLSDVPRYPLDASRSSRGVPDDSQTTEFWCPPLSEGAREGLELAPARRDLQWQFAVARTTPAPRSSHRPRGRPVRRRWRAGASFERPQVLF